MDDVVIKATDEFCWCKKKRKETMMRHPFDLELAELEAIHANLQCLTEAELETVSGGSLRATTMALGEEGGQVTTMALGEEGGSTKLAYEAGGSV
jgi:hypothetical protein